MRRLNRHLKRLVRRVESAARREDDAPLLSVESALQLLSVLYGGVMAVRARLYADGRLASHALPCRVVSVGNLVAGGAGKTPMTMFVARTLRRLGYRVVVLSRGYRGRMEDRGGVVSDGRRLLRSVQDAGDEPYLMAACLPGIPVVVGKRRYESGLLAVRQFSPDVIVLDDAFQHLRLKRNLDLVLLDRRAPLGNGHLLPRGRLREPVSALRRAGALVFTRSDANESPHLPVRLPGDRPMFFTAHIPIVAPTVHPPAAPVEKGADPSLLRGKTVVAFAGLADTDQFFDSLERLGCRVARRLAFPDHHGYLPADLRRIARSGQTQGADLLVTTLKDAVKLDPQMRWPVPLIAVHVAVRLLGDREAFDRLLLRRLEKEV